MRNNKPLLYSALGFGGGAFGALVADLIDFTSARGSVLILIASTSLWTALFAALITACLFWAGEIYHRRPGFPFALFLRGLLSGVIAGGIAGALAQIVFILPVEPPMLKNLVFKPACWAIMGGCLGWRLSTVIPNLGVGRGIIGGLVGGLIGGVGFIGSQFFVPETLGRMLGVGILGAALGLAIVTIESLFRAASLEVIWAPNEVTSISLGPHPVRIGGGDDHIYVSGLVPGAARVSLDCGKIQYTDSASGQRTALRAGSRLKIGSIEVVVHAKA